MKPLPILLLDLDGIVADFNRHSIRTYNQLHGTSLDENKCNEYMGDHEVLEPSISAKKLRAPFREVGFFINIPVIPGAKEAINFLRKNNGSYNCWALQLADLIEGKE